MSIFKNKLVVKIRWRLFLLIFFLSALPLVAIVLYSQRGAFNMLVGQSKEYYNSSLYNVVRDFQKNTNNIENVVTNLLNTKTFASINQGSTKKIIDEIKIIQKLDSLKDSLDEKNIFNQMFLNDYGDIAIVYPEQKSVFTGRTRVDYIANRNFIVDYDTLKESLYFEEMSRSVQNVKINVVDDGTIIGDGFERTNVFFVPCYQQSKLASVVMILTKQKLWDDIFIQGKKNTNKNMLFVIDKFNNILWTNDSDSNENLLTNIDIRRIMQKLDLSQGKTNASRYFGQINYKKTNWMIFSDIDITTRAKFLMLVPISNITYPIAVFVRVLVILVIVLLVLMLISSLISSNLFAKPIEHSNQTLNSENLYFMNVAHETKTPLTLVINYLDLYIKQYGTTEELRIIKDNLEKIKNNMLNFLDIGKMERGGDFSKKTQITNLIKYIQPKLQLYKITAAKKEITLQWELCSEAIIEADPFALDRILDNIVDDAIKYTEKGGNIWVTVSCTDSNVEIRVKDTGIGIEKKHLKQLFKPYHQVSSFRATTGTGLGLYIIKQLVESLDGQISATSTKGVGTEFTITLPLSTETEISDNQEPSNTMSGQIVSQPELVESNIIQRRDYSILIVEDNDDLRNYLLNVLNRYYVAYDSPNGADALELITRIPKPNLIISDVMMDKLNGFDFYEKLQQTSEYKDIPCMFLSALTALPQKLRGLEIGAIDYIQKPFEIEELLAKIKSIMNLNELKRALSEKDKYASLGILLGGISHEIFNPLAGIYGPLENLERILEKTGNMNEKSQMFIENIWTNIRRIESIVKSVKSLYKNKDLELGQTNIYEIAETVINILQTKIKNRQIEIVNLLPNDLSIYTNGSAMTQILMNLISNAIDAISEDRDDGKIVLNLYRSGNQVELQVSDNGQGIPKDKISTIFDAFYSSKEAGKGMGLGLYIVRDLIMKLGYEIKVTSEVNQGTTFRVIIQ